MITAVLAVHVKPEPVKAENPVKVKRNLLNRGDRAKYKLPNNFVKNAAIDFKFSHTQNIIKIFKINVYLV